MGAVYFSSLRWVLHVTSGSIGPDFQTVTFLNIIFPIIFFFVVCHHHLIDFAEQRRMILAYVCVCVCAASVFPRALAEVYILLFGGRLSSVPLAQLIGGGLCVCVCVLSGANPLTVVTDHVSNHSPRVHR